MPNKYLLYRLAKLAEKAKDTDAHAKESRQGDRQQEQKQEEERGQAAAEKVQGEGVYKNPKNGLT